ncbi:zinc finger protein 678-like isoform X2 [Pectinophora gossypiella]|nr:zinc finger protein 678-like isoform X2 [Pectinophora gossypiella]XP_049874562.1 zinc finger protein 678-like isoform X2 [Pectinophora gossypiella]
MKNNNIKLKNGANIQSLRGFTVSSGINKNALHITKEIMTRSGRIMRKSKDDLKVMDNILKSELLIDDDRRSKSLQSSPTNGINNNDIAISNQNDTGMSVSDHNENSPKRISKRKNNPPSGTDSAVNFVGKIRVARNIFKENTDTTKKSPNKDKTGSDNKDNSNSNKNSSKKNKDDNPKPMTPIDEVLREDVINNMKSVLSPPEDVPPPLPESDQTQIPKTRALRPNTYRVTKIKSMNIDKSKTKHVTLSNGIVLTLSLVECDHCHKTYNNKASLSRHIIKHMDLKPNKCKFCPRKFRYRSTLKNHIKRRHATGNALEFHVCHICDRTFQLLDNLELHLATHIKAESNLKCMYCEKKFSYRLLLLQHEKTHLDTGRFKCYTCEMTYDSRAQLSKHIKVHTKVKDYICQYCGKEFMKLNSIKRHVRICHGGHRVQCPICGKDLKGHLAEHMRVHEQNRPHMCPDCGQRFTQSTQLKVHRRSHTGDRPYICRICNRPFGHSNALMLHIRRHTGEKPFPCAMCPLTFSQLPHMKAHMSKIHGKDSAYKCQKCGQFFKLKNELEKHAKVCIVGAKKIASDEIVATVEEVGVEVEFESTTTLSKMRFQLALLLNMIASKEKLKYLGFNKRLIDDLLVESLEAMGREPCNDLTLSPLKRLKKNIESLLEATIPKHQMDKFKSENKTTEELLTLLTDEKKNE